MVNYLTIHGRTPKIIGIQSFILRREFSTTFNTRNPAAPNPNPNPNTKSTAAAASTTNAAKTGNLNNPSASKSKKNPDVKVLSSDQPQGGGGGGRVMAVRTPGVVLDKFIPFEGDRLPSIFMPKSWPLRWANLKGRIITTLSIGRMRKGLRKTGESWSPIDFAFKAEEIYNKMNNAFVSGDKETLSRIVSENIYSEMKNAIHRRQKEGERLIWKSEGIRASHPKKKTARVVHVRHTLDASSTFEIVQITVHFHHLQTVASYGKTGELIGGNPDQPKEVIEYIVFERFLTSLSSDWRICAKVSPPKDLKELNNLKNMQAIQQ